MDHENTKLAGPDAAIFDIPLQPGKQLHKINSPLKHLRQVTLVTDSGPLRKSDPHSSPAPALSSGPGKWL